MTLTPRYSPSGPPLVITPPASAFDPIFRQVWLDSTKPAGGNGSIGTPYNAWADAVAPLQSSGGTEPWVINLAQGLSASGVPIPNIGADGHNTGRVELRGPIQQSFYGSFENSNTVVSDLTIDVQDGLKFALDIVQLTVIGIAFPAGTLTLTGENAILSTLSEAAGSVFGLSHLIDCSLNSTVLPSMNLRMIGGTVDSTMEVDTGFLDDVEFLSSVQFRYHTSLNLTNCRFQAGAVILCDANQQLNMDLDTWGSMVAAGVVFGDTFPQMTIVPWVPVMGTVLKGGNTTCTAGGVTSVNAGVIAPQEAEKNTACIVGFGNAQNSNLVCQGANINASRELVVLVANSDASDHDLVDVLFNVTYLPRLSP